MRWAIDQDEVVVLLGGDEEVGRAAAAELLLEEGAEEAGAAGDDDPLCGPVEGRGQGSYGWAGAESKGNRRGTAEPAQGGPGERTDLEWRMVVQRSGPLR